MGKLPPQAKPVFTGEIFTVYQWQQELFDGSYATFEMLQRPDTVQVITIVDDMILLNEEEQPHKGTFLTLPGGRRDLSDTTARDAAKRELREETGYTSDHWETLFTWEPYNKMAWTMHCFIAKQAYKDTEPHLDPGEKITTRLVSFEEFITIASSKEFQAKELKEEILRMRLDPQQLAEFKNNLF